MSDSAFDASGASLQASSPASRVHLGFARCAARAMDSSFGNGYHVADAMRGFAALLVAYFHCRQVAWVGMESFHL